MSGEHSRFGGSSAPRYLKCSGSVGLLAKLPPEPTSAYAQEGINAHALGELCLRDGSRDALDYIGIKLDTGGIVTFEMASAVQVYLDAVWEACDADPKNELYIEASFVFDLPHADKGEVFGRNDALVYQPKFKRLIVFDYKHGQGVSVSVEDNEQLKFYASGAAFEHEDWPLEEVELVIVQPRAVDAEFNNGGVKRWQFSPLDLIDFPSVLDDVIVEAKAGGKLNPGPWCRKTFCAAMATCPAHEQAGLKALGLDYVKVEDVELSDLPSPDCIEEDRFPEILLALEMFADWRKAIENYIFARLRNGQPVKGFKLVASQARAKWIESEEEIANYAMLAHEIDVDDVQPRKLVGITEMKRLLKAAGATKSDIDDMLLRYTLKESSGAVLVPESDPRPVLDRATSDFASVNFEDFE